MLRLKIENKMDDIIYLSSDNTLEIRLQFIVKYRLRYTHLGKTYPKHTQCLIYENGLLKGFETIIKHNDDVDNQQFAYKLVGEKSLQLIDNKWLRSQVRIVLNKKLEEYVTFIS